MIVKICGIRTLPEALAAVEAGADMLGFNFYPPGPRYIDPSACATLVRRLVEMAKRIPTLVGVFVNVPASDIAAILDHCGLDLAQLHGDETPDTLAALGGRAFKAIRPATPGAATLQARAYLPRLTSAAAPDLLLDAAAPGLYGGTGLAVDRSVAAKLARETRLLLAGGLHPGNVAEAVAAIQPWGVDVASGVEISPGVKDGTKVRQFVERAKAAATRSGA